MCYFIVLTVDQLDAHIVKKLIRFHANPVNSNGRLQDHQAINTSFWVTNGYCSCDLVCYDRKSGYENLSDLELNEIREKTVSKLSKPKFRKRGWTSETISIEAEKRVTKARHRKYYSVKSGLHLELIEDIGSILGYVSSISLFIQTGNDNVLTPSRGKTIKLSELVNNPSIVEHDLLINITN